MKISPLFARIGSALSVASFTLAFLTYPGSSQANLTATHYQLWLNTISDTGMTRSYRGDTLVWSRVFFSIAIVLAALALVAYFWQKTEHLLTRISSVLASVALLAVPLLPSDTSQPYHNYCFFAGIVLIGASYALLYLKLKNVPYLAITLSVFAYCVFLIMLPHPSATPTIHLWHTVLQKVIITALFAVILVEGSIFRLPD